tara:strand:+ start:1866 stop:2327 length:462 start_codon:yes stop_codon:yes gene_type:complete
MAKTLKNTNTLTPVEILAISKAASASSKEVKAARELVGPGEYTGQVTVTLDYGFKVGEDYEKDQSVPWMDLALVALSKLNGTTRASIIAEMAEMKAAKQLSGKTMAPAVAEAKADVTTKIQELYAPKTAKGRVDGTSKYSAAGADAAAVREVA